MPLMINKSINLAAEKTLGYTMMFCWCNIINNDNDNPVSSGGL